MPTNRVADDLQPHEIRFYEAFIDQGNQVALIPRGYRRSLDGKIPPTNDFYWIDREMTVKLKSFDPAKRKKVTGAISSAVASAKEWGVVKDRFIIYGRKKTQPPGNLLNQLRMYNREHEATTIKQLFWWDGVSLTEIPLT